MGRWLAKFSAENQDSLPDIPDILPSVSGLSGPDSGKSAENAPPQITGSLGSEPMPPLQPGWFVVYRDRHGILCGGDVDREHGTVEACRWDGNGWTVHLTEGQRLPLSLIRSVGQTDDAGEIVAAWTVREHGYDGQGPVEGNRLRAES